MCLARLKVNKFFRAPVSLPLLVQTNAAGRTTNTANDIATNGQNVHQTKICDVNQ